MSNELFSQVTNNNSLFNAWLTVKAKGSEGGIDNVSIEMFEKNNQHYIRALSKKLDDGEYIPEPYKEILIPKDEDEFRTLGLPTVRDKIVEQTIRKIIEPILEKNFAEVSYGYRAHKGPVKAIRRTLHLIKQEKRHWVTVCDIDRYFDNISHDLLFDRLGKKLNDKRLTELIMLSVKMGRVTDRLKWKDTKKGLPQGNIISPLLSNFFLTPFDYHMLNHKFGYVRYADDFIILSHTENEAKNAFNCTNNYITEKLHLSLNPDYQIKNISQKFSFLGITFDNNKLAVSDKKFNDIKIKLRENCKFQNNTLTDKFIQSIEGIARYYGILLPQEELRKIDEYLVNLLMSKINFAYNNKIFNNKEQMRDALRRIKFFSVEYKSSENKYIDKILSTCKKIKNKDNTKGIPDISRKQIQKKKKEYQKLESGTFDLIVSSPGIFLGLTKNAISVKKKGIKQFEKRLDNLKSVTIISQGISLSSNVIQYCATHNISINFIDYKGFPYAKIFSPEHTSVNIGLAQLNAFNNGKAKKIIQQILIGKISNQLNLLKYYFKYRKKTSDDFCIAFNETIDKISEIVSDIRKNKENDIEILRGTMFAHEGRAAAIYWEMTEKLLNNYIEFSGRERKGATDPVNCLLNYGYAILYSKVSDAVIKANLNPYVSFIHKQQQGKATLIFDMVEEFRQQAVDRPVFALISKNEPLTLDNNLLSDETKKRLAEKILQRINSYETFRSKQLRLIDIIHFQTQALADFLTDKSKSYKPYIAKW